MQFQIRVIDNIEAVAVAERVPVAATRVVAAPDDIDVVGVEEADVEQHVVHCDATTATRVQFMTVDAVKEGSLAVEAHDAVAQIEAKDAEVLRHAIDHCAVASHQRQQQPLEMRRLCAPRQQPVNRQAKINLLLCLPLQREDASARGVGEAEAQPCQHGELGGLPKGEAWRK